MDTLRQDLRYAVRSLRRTPGFAVVAVLTLALGIGANTAIFSVVKGVLLEPLPYQGADRIVRVYTEFTDNPQASLSPPEFFDFRDEVEAFAELGAYVPGIPMNLTGGDAAERIRTGVVTSTVFSALGTEPRLGRTFTAEEDSPGGPAAVILSHELWVRNFSAEPEVIGTEVVVNGRSRVVVGVLPPNFRLPQEFGVRQPSELYVPLAIDRTTIPNRGSHFLHAVARLQPGLSPEQADAAIRTVASNFVEAFPEDYPSDMNFSASVVPIGDDVLGPVRPALLVLLGTVGLVLLIAVANVANLLLSRADARQREFAVRAALGAGRRRLVRQLLVESVVLAGLGGAVGLVLAHWTTRALVVLQPGEIPRVSAIGIDPGVLAFTAVISLLAGVAFGLVPALRATRKAPADSLETGGRGADTGRQSEQRMLVVVQIALTVVLLIGAGLLTRSFAELFAVDPGFRAERVLTARVALPLAEYPEEADATGFYRELLPRLRELPGVRNAGAVHALPLASELGDLNFHLAGEAPPEGDLSPRADWQVVTPGYFRSMGIPILQGRGVEPRDDADAPGAVVINEAMAERYWPDEDPIGQRFELGAGAGPGRVTVVGVVPDVRHEGLDAEPNPQMYLPHAQFRMWDSGRPIHAMTLVLSTAGDPRALAGAVRREVQRLDPNLPAADVQSMERVLSESVARPRFITVLLLLFGGLALVLATIGVYGVIAYAVTRRTREIGIRVALGAPLGNVLGMIVREGFVLTTLGILAGLVAAFAATPVLGSFLYQVSATDPLVFAGVPVALTALALLASYLPARRAAAVDPVIALRNE